MPRGCHVKGLRLSRFPACNYVFVYNFSYFGLIKFIVYLHRDFNLEKKIEALPSLSLEEFQAMKKQQRTKKKKILQKVGGSSKKTNRDNSPGRKTDMQKESEKALLVGSQKRKARKQSITRNTLTVDSPIINEEQEPNKGMLSYIKTFFSLAQKPFFFHKCLYE